MERKRSLHNLWLSFPLQKKVRVMVLPAAAALAAAVALIALAVYFGIGGFKGILDHQSESLKFRQAVDAERQAFDTYVKQGTDESLEAFLSAGDGTREALVLLPFDSGGMSEERYAKTWSIWNLYESYVEEREEFLSMEDRGDAYIEKIYELYEIQDYLSEYAGDLQQISTEEGNRQYRVILPVLFVLAASVFVMTAAFAASVFFMGRTMKRYLVEPVLLLAEEAARIGASDFSGPDPSPRGGDEMALLIKAFVTMKHSTKGYIETLKEKHEMEKQMEAIRLQMLKNQINPHFLFNTLHAIAGMAQIEDAETTERMIEALSRLFRYNLKTTASVMPLEREIAVVKDYVYLQKMRFGERITCTFDCAPETEAELVPSFALQPLIENSIVHGLAAKPEGGKIYVRTWMERGHVILSVADTGVGIPADRLAEIRLALRLGQEDKTGVGLGNIYRRIHSMCEDGQFFIDSRENCGTVIRLSFLASGKRGGEKEGGDGTCTR